MPVESESELDGMLSEPSERLVGLMRRLKGDISILGANGKIGVSLSIMAKRAIEKAGVSKEVIAASRFSEEGGRRKLEEAGVRTIPCDLLNVEELAALPRTENLVFLAGRKFGTSGGGEPLTWAMNVLAPANAAEHFKGSRIVAFSTGCVYPPLPASSGGCKESDAPAPVGEYAQSCLGRERVFQYFSMRHGTPTTLLRLNYASDLRYGVLYDIASKVWNGEPIQGGAAYFNILWQGDANNYALLALDACETPARALNITGPETLSVKETAVKFASLMGRQVRFEGEFEDKSYLNDAREAFSLFGLPSLKAETLVKMQAEWISGGGKGLGKPTHFEVNCGKY